MTEKLAIIDYGAGNLTSVRLAFEALGVNVQVTNEPTAVLSADHVVFPGVGAMGAAMRNLEKLGLMDPIRTVVERGTPFLGICLGTQIILDRSEEDGGVVGLGLVKGEVKLFTPSNPQDKVPQMGWNGVKLLQEHHVLDGIKDGSEFYFVHSYYPEATDKSYVLGETEYADVKFASIIGKDNVIATQFHPERSGKVGLKLLENFNKWDGT